MDPVNPRDEWDAATERVLAYLTLLHLGGAESRSRVALETVTQARAARAPDTPAVAAALGVLSSRIAASLHAVRPTITVESGLAALHAADAAGRWPDGFAPGELEEILARAPLASTPALDLSSMAARDMDYGALETIAQETWQQFAWTPLLRAAALWTAIFFLSLYLYDRFFDV